MNSSDDASTPRAAGVPRLVVVLLSFTGIVLTLMSLTWDTDPEDFTEEWSDSALAEPEADLWNDPLRTEGLLPVEEVDPEAELPGPEAITLDEFGHDILEDDPDHSSWGASFTNSHPDYFAAFTIELTFVSESEEETTLSYPIGQTPATVVAPGASGTYGGQQYVEFDSGTPVEAFADVTAAIVNPVWYAVDPDGEASAEGAVTFATVSAEFDSIERYLYVTVEADNSFDTAFQNGVVAVLRDGDGNIAGGVAGVDVERVQALPPGESVRTFAIRSDHLPAGIDAAQTVFVPCDAGPNSC